MGTLYVYLRKFMSFCGVCSEEDELREPLKNGLNVVLDNSLISDRYGRRVIVSNLPSGVSNCNVRNDNGGPNGSCWNSAEEMESERYSDSWLACPTKSNANAGTEPLDSNKNGYISAETYCSPELPGFERTQLVSPKGTSVSHLSSVYSRCDIEMENGGLNTARRNSSRRNKADVYTSITEVTSGESLSACSLHNSVDSRCCTNYDGDVKEKLTRLRKNSTEPNPSPTKSKKASERETKTVKKLSSLVNKTDKPTEPNLRPTKSKKASERETKTAKKLSSLVNKTEKPTGEPTSSSRSGHQGLNPINLHSDDANAVSVPNGHRLRSSEKGCLLAETDSSPKRVSQKVTSAINLNPKDVKMWVVKEKSSCTNHLMSNQQSPDLFSSSKKSCSVNGSINASLNETTASEYLQSEEQESPCIENSVEENYTGSHEALEFECFVQEDADSPKDALTCLKSVTTEPGSTSTRSKKKAPKRKTTKNCLLNNQNGKLIVEVSTSDPQSSNAVERISNKCIAISVPFSQPVGSTENGHILVKPDSVPNVLGIKKKSLLVPQKITSDTVANKKETKLWVAKEESSTTMSSLVNRRANGELKKLSGHLQSEFHAAAVENDNSVSSSQGSCENGDMLPDTDSSPKLISQKATTAIAIKPKDVMTWVAKEKSSCTNYLTSIQQSPDQSSSSDQLSSSKKFCSVDGSTSALLDSPKDVLLCPQNSITEPDSTPVKRKKKTSKCRGTQDCFLTSQTEQLIVEASTSDPQSVNAFEQISNKAIAISESYDQLLGSSEIGCILSEPDSLTIKCGSIQTSDTVENRRGVTQWVAKEECGPKTNSLVNGSANAACKKPSGHLYSEFSYAADEQESADIQRPLEGNTSTKTRRVRKKTPSAIVSKQNEFQLRVPKEKSSSIDHLISTQQSRTLQKPFLVNVSAYDDELKKTTLEGFSTAPEERETPYADLDHSLKGSKGSQTHKEVITRPTIAGVVVERKIQGYCSSQKILLVGEGNFSFSACLARAFDSARNMVATSLNSEEYLNCYYKGALGNISELKRRGCIVLHDVDATTVANHSNIKGQSFDRIIYNFPHCGDFSLTKQALRKNRALVRLFMENSSKMIEKDGEIHIRHKTTKSFSQWDLNGLASEAGLVLIEEARFHLRKFKGYETKYGYEGGKFSSDDNFDCYPCRTYKFALPQHQKAMGRQNSKLNA